MYNLSAWHFIIFFVCLLVAAFFCSAETAFLSMPKLRLQHLIRNGNASAKRVALIIEKPEKFLSTVLLGINLFETAVATVGTIIAVSFWGENVGAVIATVVVTVLTLILAELIPKTLAARHAQRLSLLYARPIEIIAIILYPIVWVLNRIGLKMTEMTDSFTQSKPTISEEEFRTAIDIGEEEGVVEEEAAEMLHNVFEFGDLTAKEIMIPKLETTFLEKGTSIQGFFEIYAQSPRSRFPVYEGTLDNVVGVLSIKDVLMSLAKNKITHQSSIDELIRPAYFAPENKLVTHLFTEMRDNNYHIAIVVDEYGTTLGAVSFDQITSSIVGPVSSELENLEKEYEKINENTFQIDGGMRIEEVNQEMGLDLPKDGYETIAGFLLHLLGRIPKQGEQIRYRNMKIIITKMQSARIVEILVTKDSTPAQNKTQVKD
jgi:putative hemolysin